MTLEVVQERRRSMVHINLDHIIYIILKVIFKKKPNILVMVQIMQKPQIFDQLMKKPTKSMKPATKGYSKVLVDNLSFL